MTYQTRAERMRGDINAVLTEAADIIEAGGWTRQPWACDGGGEQVNPWDPKARAWSLGGAVELATIRVVDREGRDDRGDYYTGYSNNLYRRVLDRVAKAVDPIVPISALRWNDEKARDAREVITTLRAAITE